MTMQTDEYIKTQIQLLSIGRQIEPLKISEFLEMIEGTVEKKISENFKASPSTAGELALSNVRAVKNMAAALGIVQHAYGELKDALAKSTAAAKAKESTANGDINAVHRR